MALKRVKLVFYMELDESSQECLHGRNQIINAAIEAMKDGLHVVSNATIEQASKDNWEDSMYPYNREDDTPLIELLAQEKK